MTPTDPHALAQMLKHVQQAEAEAFMVKQFLHEAGTDPEAWIDGVLDHLKAALQAGAQALRSQEDRREDDPERHLARLESALLQAQGETAVARAELAALRSQPDAVENEENRAGSWGCNCCRQGGCSDGCACNARHKPTRSQPEGAGQGWQPIETLHGDEWNGRAILVWVPFDNQGDVKQCSYMVHREASGKLYLWGEGRMHELPYTPTHWRPTPEPPSATSPASPEKAP